MEIEKSNKYHRCREMFITLSKTGVLMDWHFDYLSIPTEIHKDLIFIGYLECRYDELMHQDYYCLTEKGREFCKEVYGIEYFYRRRGGAYNDCVLTDFYFNLSFEEKISWIGSRILIMDILDKKIETYQRSSFEGHSYVDLTAYRENGGVYSLPQALVTLDGKLTALHIKTKHHRQEQLDKIAFTCRLIGAELIILDAKKRTLKPHGGYISRIDI